MDTNIVITCALLVGCIFGGIAGFLSGLATGQGRLDAAQAEGDSVGYRRAQHEEMERAGQQLVARQSAAIQQRQAEEAARQYRVQRGALG